MVKQELIKPLTRAHKRESANKLRLSPTKAVARKQQQHGGGFILTRTCSRNGMFASIVGGGKNGSFASIHKTFSVPLNVTEEGSSVSDHAPKIPRRCSSTSNHAGRTAMRQGGFPTAEGAVSSQHNAVFNSSPSRKRSSSVSRPSWYTEKFEKKDAPPRKPSIRNESMSALSAFASIRLASCKSIASMNKDNKQHAVNVGPVVSPASSVASSPPLADEPNLMDSPAQRKPQILLDGTIEVDGERTIFRGEEETWKMGIQRDFYLPMSCQHCCTELCCIKDVFYVMCPSCENLTSTEGFSEVRRDSVGIGLTLQDLRRWEMTGSQRT